MPFHYSYTYGFRDKILSAKEILASQKTQINEGKQKDSFKYGSR